MREQVATRDRKIASIAASQFGVVTFAQLSAAGIDKSAASRRIKKGHLHRIHRGVYAVGHRALGWRGIWTAAVLACGDGAVLSHTSAAALWGFLRPVGGPIDITVPGEGGRARRVGIRLHRSRTLAATDVARRHGIAVTTPVRTITDLHGAVESRLHRRATRQAELAGHRIPRRFSTHRTRSDLELDFLAFCRQHRLPRPEVNVRIGRHRVDFLWRDARLAVETDSWNYHRGAVAFEDDHARDLALRQRGIDVIRLTGSQLENEAARVAATLRDQLDAASRRQPVAAET